MMKVLITGGHFSPAQAVLAELKKRGVEVFVVGRRHPFEGDKSLSFEYLVSERENLPFYEIKTGRFQRKFTAYTISSLLKTPSGFFSSISILRKVRPDVVITFGGYIGLPVGLAAAVMGIPVVLHEQTQNMGLAARFLSYFAQKICISFKSSETHFPESKTVFTGNPVRAEIIETKNKIPLPAGKVVYITGGSTGSHFINSLMYEIAEKLLSDFILVHQTGESLKYDDYDRLQKLRESFDENKKKRYILRKFIFPEEIGSIFAQADLILSRSGANSVSEIMMTQKMSLLIPLPHGQDNEQLVNAKLIESLGIGEYIEQDNATSVAVLSKIHSMSENENVYRKNMGKTKEFVVLGAASKIADVIKSVYDKKRD